MAKSKTSVPKPSAAIRKLNFLIGKWHTTGEILPGVTNTSNEIRGMDTYEWTAGGFFILHRVDVFLAGKKNRSD